MIRYCAAAGGRVAYSTVGSGPALLCDSGWVTHLRAQLELFSYGAFIDRLAKRFTVIRYDKPGWRARGDGVHQALLTIGYFGHLGQHSVHVVEQRAVPAAQPVGRHGA